MIHAWSDDELAAAYAMISLESQGRTKAKAKNMKYSLREGDQVSFNGAKSGKLSGVVFRVKYKKALVDVKNSSGSATRWDVPLGMLSKN
jgi:hypothetical protein